MPVIPRTEVMVIDLQYHHCLFTNHLTGRVVLESSCLSLRGRAGCKADPHAGRLDNVTPANETQNLRHLSSQFCFPPLPRSNILQSSILPTERFSSPFLSHQRGKHAVETPHLHFPLRSLPPRPVSLHHFGIAHQTANNHLQHHPSSLLPPPHALSPPPHPHSPRCLHTCLTFDRGSRSRSPNRHSQYHSHNHKMGTTPLPKHNEHLLLLRHNHPLHPRNHPRHPSRHIHNPRLLPPLWTRYTMAGTLQRKEGRRDR